MASTINTASDAARRGDWAGCLEALLAAWRPERPIALAELIERVGNRMPERHTAKPTAADVSPILAKLEPREIDRLIELSTTVGPDPRIAKRLAAIFEHSPVKNREGRLDLAVLAALDAIDDPRYRDAIARAAQTFEKQRANPTKKLRVDQLVATAEAVRERPAPPGFTIPPELTAELDRRVDPDQLLDAIYADPSDTALRLVYADALQQLGDPRGEFIALQCTGTLSKKRERKFLAAYERTWLGALRPFVRDVAFLRGFPAIAGLGRLQIAVMPRDREWQLIEQLDVSRHWGSGLVALLESMRGLRRVTRLYGELYQRLDGPLPWTCIGVESAATGFAKLFTANRHALLPQLQDLELTMMRLDPLIRELGDLSGLRVRITPNGTTLADVTALIERHAIVMITKEYAFQVGSQVTIANGVATTNDQPFMTSVQHLIP